MRTGMHLTTYIVATVTSFSWKPSPRAREPAIPQPYSPWRPRIFAEYSTSKATIYYLDQQGSRTGMILSDDKHAKLTFYQAYRVSTASSLANVSSSFGYRHEFTGYIVV
jgi:hypothetical protein